MQLPCFDVEGVTSTHPDEKAMVKKCLWKGMPINCAAIFQTFPSDRGMCCAFNMAKAEQLFHSSDYSQMVGKMQSRDKEHAYGNKTQPSWFELTAKVGRSKGLTLVLDAHTDLIAAGTINDDVQGFYAVVNEPFKYPLVNEGSQLVQSGHVSYVSISATSIVADQELGQLESPNYVDPQSRGCYFQHEYQLQIHRNYSRANCVFECLLIYAYKETNEICIPWYFPPVSNATKPCDPWSTKQFLQVMSRPPDNQCDHCLPDCETIIYSTTSTASKFRRCDEKNFAMSLLCSPFLDQVSKPPIWAQHVKEDYVNDMGVLPFYVGDGMLSMETNKRRYSDQRQAIFASLTNEQPYYDAYQEDFAVAHFFFDSPTAFQFEKSARLTLLDYISQIGGLLGLFIGFSVISGIEIIYWLTFRLAKNVLGQKRISDIEEPPVYIPPLPPSSGRSGGSRCAQETRPMPTI